MYATLLESGLTIGGIAELTDRQIADLYFHRRDKDGRLERRLDEPEELPPLSPMESARRDLLLVGAILHISREELEATWAEKYGDEPL